MQSTLTGARFHEVDAPQLAVDGAHFDVGVVGGLIGSISPFPGTVTLVGDGPQLLVGLAEFLEVLTRRGASVTTWPAGVRPDPPPPWRWTVHRG